MHSTIIDIDWKKKKAEIEMKIRKQALKIEDCRIIKPK